MSLRGTSRGLTYTACGYIGVVSIFYSSTLGCDVAICWKALLLQRRFREIATAPNVRVYWVIVSKRNK